MGLSHSFFFSSPSSPASKQVSDPWSAGWRAGREVTCGLVTSSSAPCKCFKLALLRDSGRSFETSLLAEDHSSQTPLEWLMYSPMFCSGPFCSPEESSNTFNVSLMRLHLFFLKSRFYWHITNTQVQKSWVYILKRLWKTRVGTAPESTHSLCTVIMALLEQGVKCQPFIW